MARNQDSAQPLKGLKVLDLTRLLPGPLCTMILGDYGAEVIKVEDVDAGDPTRFVGSSDQNDETFFKQLNRNKRSIAIDLKSAAGRKIIKKLAADADVLVEGFRPGVMAKLNLDYETLKEINPGLIYASLSGYGQQGSFRKRAGHDINYTALTGLLDLSAEAGAAPVLPAVQIADIAAGSLMAISGIMFALYEHKVNGKGNYIDISMTRGLLPFLIYAASAPAVESDLPRRGGGHITGAFACYNIYRTADDKYMSLGALEPVFWATFCNAVRRPQWIELQFDQDKREDLIDQLGSLFQTKTRAEWVRFFSGIDACCEPVLNLDEAISHPLSTENDYWLQNIADDGKTLRRIGFPLLFQNKPGNVRKQPPEHGEHSVEILKEIGYTDSQITILQQNRVIK